MAVTRYELPNGVQLWSGHPAPFPGGDRWPDELSADERARADRYRSERDRHRFVTRRVFARRVLADYLGVAPAAIRFRVSAYGRPELDPDAGLSFNVSHSDGTVVLAVSRTHRVGVDIERIRPIDEARALASRFFSQREVAALATRSESSVSEAFLTIWTRKESYIKAVGAGLSMPLDAFDVSTPAGTSSSRPRDLRGETRFVCTSLRMFDGFAAAVSVSDQRLVRVSPGPVAAVA